LPQSHIFHLPAPASHSDQNPPQVPRTHRIQDPPHASFFHCRLTTEKNRDFYPPLNLSPTTCKHHCYIWAFIRTPQAQFSSLPTPPPQFAQLQASRSHPRKPPPPFTYSIRWRKMIQRSISETVNILYNISIATRLNLHFQFSHPNPQSTQEGTCKLNSHSKKTPPDTKLSLQALAAFQRKLMTLISRKAFTDLVLLILWSRGRKLARTAYLMIALPALWHNILAPDTDFPPFNLSCTIWCPMLHSILGCFLTLPLPLSQCSHHSSKL